MDTLHQLMFLDVTTDEGWLNWLFGEMPTSIDEKKSASHLIIGCASCGCPIEVSSAEKLFTESGQPIEGIEGLIWIDDKPYHSNVLTCVEWSVKTGGIGGDYGQKK